MSIKWLIVFDTLGIKEVDSGFRITHFCTTHPLFTLLPSLSRFPPPLSIAGGGGDLKSEGRRVKRGCVVQKCVILNPLSTSLIPLVSKTINQRTGNGNTKGSFNLHILEIATAFLCLSWGNCSWRFLLMPPLRAHSIFTFKKLQRHFCVYPWGNC